MTQGLACSLFVTTIEMKNCIFITFYLLLPTYLFGQKTNLPDPAYSLLAGKSFVQSKNYYLLTLLEEVETAKNMLRKDQNLSMLAASKLSSLESAMKECKADYLCYTSKMKFSEREIQSVGERLDALYADNNALGQLAKKHLIPSGAYILLQTATPKELLRKAWEQDARAVNHAIEVYAEGRKPNYPAIDSIGFNCAARSFPTLVYDCSNVVRQENKNTTLFFVPSMHFALQFLEVNERNEASDYEPMASTVNKAAFNKIKKTDWSKFSYTMILVPGAGPNAPERALSEGGILRCRIAALRYFEGMAPFILVSGGRVHPYKTKFSEAFEMKQYLMQTLHVPEEAIIMDPHARHTTTNMRNAVRLLFRYGMPVNKPCIVSTVRSQSYYITNDAFVNRCMKEINHVPYKLGKRLTDTEFEFFPVLDALQIDADEPLDP
jgi:hypothetical protein